MMLLCELSQRFHDALRNLVDPAGLEFLLDSRQGRIIGNRFHPVLNPPGAIFQQRDHFVAGQMTLLGPNGLLLRKILEEVVDFHREKIGPGNQRHQQILDVVSDLSHQLVHFHASVHPFNRRGHDQIDLPWLKWLGDEVHGALFHGFHSQSDRAVGGHHDHGEIRPALSYAFECLDAIELRHRHIEKGEVKGMGLYRGECRLSVIGCYNVMPEPSKSFGETEHDVRIVVCYQNPNAHGSPPSELIDRPLASKNSQEMCLSRRAASRWFIGAFLRRREGKLNPIGWNRINSDTAGLNPYLSGYVRDSGRVRSSSSNYRRRARPPVPADPSRSSTRREP